MKREHQTLITTLIQYLEQYPEIRFGQALYNLGINEFADKKYPASKKFLLRDIYNDTDEQILSRLEFKDIKEEDSAEIAESKLESSFTSNIREQILNTFPDEKFWFADGFDSCILGVDSDSTPMRIIYSVKKAIKKIFDDMDVSESDLDEDDKQNGVTIESKKMELAKEHFDFNVRGSKGKGYPVWNYDDLDY